MIISTNILKLTTLLKNAENDYMLQRRLDVELRDRKQYRGIYELTQ